MIKLALRIIVLGAIILFCPGFSPLHKVKTTKDTINAVFSSSVPTSYDILSLVNFIITNDLELCTFNEGN